MEIDEIAARVVRRYWPLLLLATIMPVLITAGVVSAQEPRYVAVVRLDVPNPNADVAGDAGVALTVSQVKAFATGDTLLRAAIREQGVQRSPARLVPDIDVLGLGVSSVVELRVIDNQPQVGRRLADAVAAKVVTQLNTSNNQNLTGQIAALDQQIARLSKRLTSVSTKAQTPTNFNAINEKASLQTRIDRLESDRADLRGQLATIGVARVVQPAVTEELGSGATARLVLAALLGLIGGVLITVVIEAFRPTVPGAHRVARRLGVPLLGHVDADDALLTDAGRRILLAARREFVVKVALVGADGTALPADLVSRVTGAVQGGPVRLVPTSSVTTSGGTPRGPAHAGNGQAATPAGTAGTGVNGRAPGHGDDGRSDGIGFPDESGLPLDTDPAAGTDPATDADAGTDIDLATDTGSPADAGPAANADPADDVTPDGAGARDDAGRRTGARNAAVAVLPATTVLVDDDVADPVAALRHGQCRVYAFEDIDPGTDSGPFGLVAVAGPVTTLSAIRSIHDLSVASGWPLLGVLATTRRLRGK